MYYVVTIKNLRNKKEYDVVVEIKGEPYKSELYQSLEKRTAILDAMEQIAHKLTKSKKSAFIHAAKQILYKSRGYDAFVRNLKNDLNIKVKAKKGL